ncbi:MAG TPA: substrate-binding domain-containing protein [Oscillospiraceae bacterium]|nr:substrate-binding domain-containing protein [Oscillospiraceae bacterium]
MKKIISILTAAICLTTLFAGCSNTGNSSSEKTTESGTTGAETTTAAESKSDFDTSEMINVVSREDGSGTRGAFIELVGVEQKDADGKKVDHTTEEAMITNSTSVMMTTVAGDDYAIGYISLGSLNDTVKAVKVDGAEATAENVKSGTYKVSRPFNIVTMGKESDIAKDFIAFILSADGQKVVEDNHYISTGNTGAYKSAGLKGKLTIAGSSSVTPVMEKLKEAYNALNADIIIEIQQSDSTTGVSSAIEGVCDIGMASRELKDSETEKGAKATVIAKDGIAIIVNKNNTCNELTTEQIKNIYTGDTTDWSFLK